MADTDGTADAPKATVGKAASTDWEAIEREFRAGQLSVSEIGRQYGISHTAINKRAKREGWTRDLTEKVRKEVSARLVSEGVSAEGVRETIQLAAERGVALVREHRSDIGQNRSAVTKLIAELHEGIEHHDEIVEDIEAETTPQEGASPTEKANLAKRRARMLAAVALPSRASVANTLATALKTLIPLERQAFNLDDKGDPPDGSQENPVNATLSDQSIDKIKRLLE